METLLGGLQPEPHRGALHRAGQGHGELHHPRARDGRRLRGRGWLVVPSVLGSLLLGLADFWAGC